MYNLTILVNGGDVFDGNLIQWEDTFFCFPIEGLNIGEQLSQETLAVCLPAICDFCEEMGWNVEIKYQKS